MEQFNLYRNTKHKIQKTS